MTTERVNFTDYLTLDAPRRTAEHGYLAATAVVARTGIQVYRGHEVGRPDLERVRVWRPEAEVFHEDAMRSFAHRPVTNDHPPVPVTSENWRKYAVGQVGDEVVRDGQHVKVPILLMDAGVIRDYEAGKRAISQGYSCELRWGSGTTPEGELYDATQTQIRANHTAVVDAARGGPEVRIVDKTKEKRMKTITVDGLSVQVEDRDAEIVQRTIDKLTKQITTDAETMEEMKKRHAAEIAACATKDAEAKKLSDAKDAEIATLKKQLSDSEMTPAKLDVMVKDRALVITKARVLLGDALVSEGKTDSEIRRQVVDSVMGADSKGWSDDQVSASFAMIAKKNITEDKLAAALSNSQVDAVTSLDKAYEDRDKALENAWKPKAA